MSGCIRMLSFSLSYLLHQRRPFAVYAMLATPHRVTPCLVLGFAALLVSLLPHAQAVNTVTVGRCFRDQKCRDHFAAPIDSYPDQIEPIWATCMSFMPSYNFGYICKTLDCKNCEPMIVSYCYGGGPWDAYCPGRPGDTADNVSPEGESGRYSRAVSSLTLLHLRRAGAISLRARAR